MSRLNRLLYLSRNLSIFTLAIASHNFDFIDASKFVNFSELNVVQPKTKRRKLKICRLNANADFVTMR